ncbi:hypothetical protein C8J56DRAFT_227394 [Mycena floridula]|nr:hypothetical protein C8J56DRAFT_227394 [Mycena floridula]
MDSSSNSHLTGGLANALNSLTPPPSTTAIPVTVEKRRVGRPKGSGKKSKDSLVHVAPLPNPQKVKRPVGRPRKDGFPAGSLGNSGKKKTSSQTAGPSNVGDQWAELANSDPNALLSVIVEALSATHPAPAMGSSVDQAFKSHLVSLSPSTSSHPPNVPSLYSIMKTFWLPSSPVYFQMTGSGPSRIPSEHRFLYWDPQALVINGLSCPTCSSTLFSNRGRIRSGPITVYDLERPFYIIGCEYVCASTVCLQATSGEGRKYASTDPAILRILPTSLLDEFPARLAQSDLQSGISPDVWNWHARGISKGLWNMIRGCIKTGMRKEAIIEVLNTIENGVHDDSEDGDGDIEKEAEETTHRTAPGVSGSEAAKEPNIHQAYHEAWMANTAVVDNHNTVRPSDRTMSATPTTPSIAGSPIVTPTSSLAANSTQSTGSTYSQPFAFVQQYPAANYSYTHYNYPGTSPSIPTSAGGISPGLSASSSTIPPAMPRTISSPVTPSIQVMNHSSPNIVSHNQLKRNYPFGDEMDSQDNSDSSRKRSPRHCPKCGESGCKGKGGRTFCSNKCQDCGLLDCRGRNSRRPEKNCAEGWL